MYPRLIIQAKCVELKRIYLERHHRNPHPTLVICTHWCQIYVGIKYFEEIRPTSRPIIFLWQTYMNFEPILAPACLTQAESMMKSHIDLSVRVNGRDGCIVTWCLASLADIGTCPATSNWQNPRRRSQNLCNSTRQSDATKLQHRRRYQTSLKCHRTRPSLHVGLLVDPKGPHNRTSWTNTGGLRHGRGQTKNWIVARIAVYILMKLTNTSDSTFLLFGAHACHATVVILTNFATGCCWLGCSLSCSNHEIEHQMIPMDSIYP